MQADNGTSILKEKLWKRLKEEVDKKELSMKERDLFDAIYDNAQTHLMDIMKDIFENDIELFSNFFE